MRYVAHVFAFAAVLGILALSGCGGGGSAEMTERTETATTLLPGNSSIIAMVDLQHVRENAPNGERMMKRFTEDASPGMEEDLEELGLDPATDIQSVYVGGRFGESGRAPLALIYGSFERENIESFIDRKMQESPERIEFEKTSIRDYTAYQVTNATDQLGSEAPDAVGAALVSDNLIIAGDMAEVEAAVTRYDGEGAGSLADAAATMSLVREAATGQSMWAVVGEVPEQLRSRGDNQMERLTRVVRSVTAAMTFDGGDLDTRILLTAEDGASASDIADLTRGLVGLAKREGRIESDWQQVIQTIEVSDEGDNVEITGRVDRSLIEKEAEEMTQTSADATTASRNVSIDR